MRAFIYRNFIHPILKINDTAESIALGTAMGLVIAMTPTVGIQMVLVIILGTIVRANRFAGIVMVYLSNPFTMIPIYWLDYWVGAQVMGIPRISKETFEASFTTFGDILGDGGIWAALSFLMELKLQIVVPMFLGGTLVGLLLAAPAYPLTLGIVRAHQRRKSHKKALQRLRELRRQEREQERRGGMPKNENKEIREVGP